MTNQIYEGGDATEGIMAIAYIRQSPEILKVFDIFYYDPDAEDLKVGARTPNRRGSMRRLLRLLGHFTSPIISQVWDVPKYWHFSLLNLMMG